ELHAPSASSSGSNKSPALSRCANPGHRDQRLRFLLARRRLLPLGSGKSLTALIGADAFLSSAPRGKVDRGACSRAGEARFGDLLSSPSPAERATQRLEVRAPSITCRGGSLAYAYRPHHPAIRSCLQPSEGAVKALRLRPPHPVIEESPLATEPERELDQPGPEPSDDHLALVRHAFTVQATPDLERIARSYARLRAVMVRRAGRP